MQSVMVSGHCRGMDNGWIGERQVLEGEVLGSGRRLVRKGQQQQRTFLHLPPLLEYQPSLHRTHQQVLGLNFLHCAFVSASVHCKNAESGTACMVGYSAMLSQPTRPTARHAARVNTPSTHLLARSPGLALEVGFAKRALRSRVGERCGCASRCPRCDAERRCKLGVMKQRTAPERRPALALLHFLASS